MKPLDFLKEVNERPQIAADLHDALNAIFKDLMILSPQSYRFGDGEPVQIPNVHGAQPGAAQPGVAQPGVAQPGAAQPGVAQPGAVQPGNVQQAMQQAQQAQPGNVQGMQPGMVQPGMPMPGVVQPQAAAPGLTPMMQPGHMVDEAQATALSESIWPQLYSRYYTRSELSEAEQQEQGMWSAPSDPAFVAELSKANQTQQGWDPGWQVYQLGQGGVLNVSKGTTYRQARPGEYVFGAPMRQPQVGDVVDLIVHRESTAIQGGYYHAFGQSANSEFDDTDTARLYFNLDGSEGPWLVELLTGRLNRFRIPFRFKCPDAPARFQRADAAVLYVARRHISVVLRLLRDQRPEFERRMRDDVPLFATKLARGVGGADDPGTGQSFGQARVKLVAEGVIDAWRAGLQDADGRLRFVHQRFHRMGLALAKPHLNEHAVDVYVWPESF